LGKRTWRLSTRGWTSESGREGLSGRPQEERECRASFAGLLPQSPPGAVTASDVIGYELADWAFGMAEDDEVPNRRYGGEVIVWVL
jgi:hypothetical protein